MATKFPSPHPGIINFFYACNTSNQHHYCFRPLIRGLSISSRILSLPPIHKIEFPSPHPGIINFFENDEGFPLNQKGFPSPHPGIINFFSRTAIHSRP